MAELVGDAYIRITADTRGMRNALAAQMKRAGKDAGHAFSDEVERIQKQEAKAAQSRFAKAIVNPKEFDKMAKEFDSVEHAAKAWGDQLTLLRKQGHIAKGETAEYRKAIKAWETQAIATRKAAKDLNDMLFEAHAEDKKRTKEKKQQVKDLRTIYERDHGEALRMVREAQQASKQKYEWEWAEAIRTNKRIDAARKKAIKQQQDANEAIRKAMKQHYEWEWAEALRMNRKHDQLLRAAAEKQRVIDRDHARVLRDIEKHRLRTAEQRRKDASKDSDFFRRSAHHIDRLAALTGKAFGKGMRNNFFNLIGSMVGGLAKLVAAPVKVALGMIGGFVTAFKGARAASMGFFKSVGQGILGMFGKGGVVGLVAGFGLLLAGVKAVSVALPAMVSLIGLAATAVVQLTAAVSYGLAGALLAATPAALGLAAGLGGVFAVITNFRQNKDNKKFLDNLFTKPLDDLTKRQTPAIKKFLQNIGAGFKGFIKDVEPSITAFWASWKKNMNDPTTKAGLKNFGDSIGRIATTFNTSLPNLLSGIIGFFQPILPYAEKLATKIGEAFKTFDDWANSKPGRNAIADFMLKAWTNAQQVWQILKDIGGIIGTVFDFGQPGGSTFLEGIHGWLQKIQTYLDNPANKDKIDTWFANAQQIGMDIGHVATGIGDIVKSLSSKEGQEGAKNIAGSLGEIGKTAKTIGDVAEKINAVSDALGAAWGWLNKINDFLTLDPSEGIGGWLHDKIYGKDKKPPKPVTPSQLVTTPKTAAQVQTLHQEVVTTYRNKLGPETPMLQQQIKAIDDYRFKDKTIPIKGNEELWAVMRDTAAAYVFTEKQIPVKGNMKEWDAAKGTAQGFVFDTKTINVEGDTSGLKAAIANAKRWLSTLPASKKIRIAGVTQGGITINAAGGMYDKPTLGVFGEAGPEAIVPLNRPLSMVDPAVRSLSAFAQGLSGPKGLPAANTGPRVNFSEGAIQVNLPTGDPKLAAEAVLDRLVAFIG